MLIEVNLLLRLMNSAFRDEDTQYFCGLVNDGTRPWRLELLTTRKLEAARMTVVMLQHTAAMLLVYLVARGYVHMKCDTS
jgi:hypothetical protein